MTTQFRSIYAMGPIALAATFSLCAQNLTVLNAASFSAGSVAPGSIVTMFGSNLSAGTGAATDAGHPPVMLAQTTVTIGGAMAGLFYVSPSQINAVIPASLTAGVQTVVVSSPAGIVTGTVTVDVNATPGLFSTTGTGTHDGAIIDALTGRLGAFSVVSGSQSTFLSLFLTGANLAATPSVLVGGQAATVTYAGVSPCCQGLQQINVTLPAALAGAGRVPVTVTAAGRVSNVVEIVLLPPAGEGEFDGDADNQTRSRELSSIASVPGTSVALVTDENDDVVRVMDIAGRKVIHTIALAGGSEPVAMAVNAAGTLAVVAERGRGKIALLDLTTFLVKTEIAVGAGPVGLAIAGTQALVANGDSSSISVVDLTAGVVLRTITVGAAPHGIAIDASGRAWVTSQNAGTISMVDPVAGTVLSTVNLGTTRPTEIQLVAGTGFALVTDPAASGAGNVLLVNLNAGTYTTLNIGVASGGGANALAVWGTTAWVADQTAGTISVLPLVVAAGQVGVGTVTTVRVGRGVRSLAIDGKDQALLAVSESAGTVTVVSLATNQVVATIRAVTGEAGEGDSDDHSDHDRATNLPVVSAVSPGSARASSLFVLTLTGRNLSGATGVAFVEPGNMQENKHGKGAGGMDGGADTAFTVTGISVNATGTVLTANVVLGARAKPGARFVQVATPNGESGVAGAAVFTVMP